MKYVIKEYADIKKQVEKMSAEELLRCVICPDFPPEKRTPVKNTVALMLHPTTLEVAKEALTEVNKNRKDRALVAVDMEYGAGKALKGATRFPSMRAAAETQDETLAYKMGVIAAREAIEAGYTWTFGPCVDILANHRNPIVSIRTSGEDADTVIRYGGAYMRGLQDTGLIATLKHFPGDGYSINDQHITTTENPLSREEWDASFGKVYKTLIEDGVKAIMPGHISLPSYDEIDAETGLYPPATLSKPLMSGLLRQKLGFEGIIVSDAISMTGFCGYMNMWRACARFLESGGDCLLFFHEDEESFSEMKRLIEKGELTMETLRSRAYRMLCFAREYYSEADQKKGNENAQVDLCDADECLAAMVKKSVRLVRNRAELLPISADRSLRVAHIVLSNLGTPQGAMDAPDELTKMLKDRFDKVEELRDPGPGNAKLLAKSGEYDLIICSVSNEMSWGLNTVKLSGPMARNMMSGWMRYGTPVVFVSYFDPYFHEDFTAAADTVINTYGFSKYTNRAVLDTIFGKEN